MAKKKQLTQNELVSAYMDYFLEHHKAPTSIFSFTKSIGREESEFYPFFTSFDQLEKSVFTTFFSQTFELLEKSEDYSSFDSRTKLLSFYFTYFELLTANRSFVLALLKDGKPDLKSMKTMSGLKEHFEHFIAQLDLKTIDLKHAKAEELKEKSIKNIAWGHFMVTLKFWMDDSSASFEKTDLFIEKSVNASFDLIEVTPLKSLIDFGKFIYKEKMNIK